MARDQEREGETQTEERERVIFILNCIVFGISRG